MSIIFLSLSTLSAHAASGREDPSSLVPEKFKNRPIVAVAGEDSAPVYFRDADGKLVGMGIDITNAIAKKLGIQLSIKTAAFDAVIPGIQSGKYDIGIWAAGVTEERKKIINIVPYYSSKYVFVEYRTDKKPTIKNNQGLCGRTVAVLAQSSASPAIDAVSEECVKAGRDKIVQRVFPSIGDTLVATMSGRTDCVVYNILNASWLNNTKPNYVFGDAEVDPHLAGYIFPKTSPQLARAWSAALQELISSGTYTKILDKYNSGRSAIDHASVVPPLSNP
jgi:polar amino acid transport system substrate-binding protein